MKTKILIGAILLAFTLISCSKDESSNTGKLKVVYENNSSVPPSLDIYSVENPSVVLKQIKYNYGTQEVRLLTGNYIIKGEKLNEVGFQILPDRTVTVYCKNDQLSVE